MNISTVSLFLISFSIAVTAAQGLICPQDDVIYPCKCTTVDSGLLCDGPEVTQGSIDRAFKVIRGYNSLRPSDWLNLFSHVQISETELVTLDLSPLMNLSTVGLRIQYNSKLTSIKGPGWPHQESINVTYLAIQMNALTDEGLGQSLKYFTPNLIWLVLPLNNLRGTTGSWSDVAFEFLPGLSNFVNLQSLTFTGNPVETIGGGGFASNVRMDTMYFERHNLTWIGENAFSFNSSPPDRMSVPRMIILDSNRLNDESMNMAVNGLLSSDRPVVLYLNFNAFEFLSRANFEQFLLAHEDNEIMLAGNPLVCDERMKWLKDGKDVYQKHVINALCSNDPGHTVFNSPLIE
jgi:hypothetical protein